MSLTGEKRFQEFNAWSQFLHSVDSALNVEQAKNNYFRKHISPVLALPPAVCIMAMSCAVSPSSFVPSGHLAVISLGFIFACMIGLRRFSDKLSLLSIACLALASLFEGFQRNSVDYRPTCSLLVPLPLIAGMHLVLSVSAILRLASLLMFLSLPFQEKHGSFTTGVMRSCVPHLLVVMWWELVCLFFSASTWSELAEALGFYLVLSVSIPVSGLLMLYSIVSALASVKITFVLVTLVILAASWLCVRLLQRKFDLSTVFRKLNLGVSMRIVLVIFGVIIGAMLYLSLSCANAQHSKLQQTEYGDLCLSNQHGLNNRAEQQRLCHVLNGYRINWTGEVKAVEVVSIENKVRFTPVGRVTTGQWPELKISEPDFFSSESNC